MSAADAEKLREFLPYHEENVTLVVEDAGEALAAVSGLPMRHSRRGGRGGRDTGAVGHRSRQPHRGHGRLSLLERPDGPHPLLEALRGLSASSAVELRSLFPSAVPHLFSEF